MLLVNTGGDGADIELREVTSVPQKDPLVLFSFLDSIPSGHCIVMVQATYLLEELSKFSERSTNARVGSSLGSLLEWRWSQSTDLSSNPLK
jgi:hypothetical protein